ncbi:MAG: rhomboid family intramembrane serine protease [Pseudomonadota bacterium]|nr:rhomboid family intramembrane serine protease [Pseudomonadota bacterium]
MQQPTRISPPVSAFSPVVRALLIANGAVFALHAFSGDPSLIAYFALWPLDSSAVLNTPSGIVRLPGFIPWQLVTYGFLHASLSHLFFNMFALWMFGTNIERAIGSRRFAAYYFVCIVGAALVQLLVLSPLVQGEPITPHPTVGASGGVFGILLAFGMLFPEQRILLLIPPIPIKAKWFVLGYGVIELWFGVTGAATGVAHFAHLGGMLFGFLLLQYWRGRFPFHSR